MNEEELEAEINRRVEEYDKEFEKKKAERRRRKEIDSTKLPYKDLVEGLEYEEEEIPYEENIPEEYIQEENEGEEYKENIKEENKEEQKMEEENKTDELIATTEIPYEEGWTYVCKKGDNGYVEIYRTQD